MSMVIIYMVLALAITAITYKTYVGYGEYNIVTKISVLLFLLLSLSAPFICHYIHHMTPTAPQYLIYISNALYVLFAFVFLVFVISFMRDTVWLIITLIRRLPMETMDNAEILKKLNITTLIIALLISCYGIYGGLKAPEIKTYTIQSSKIKKPTKVVLLVDTHIDVSISPKKVRKLVQTVNELKPDVIAMPGDIIDNSPRNIYQQMKEFQKLKARFGRFITLGNHEFYAGELAWALEFAQLGFDFQNNVGSKIADTGLYIAGIPDIPSAAYHKMPIKIDNAMHNADKDDYVVLLSHSPKIAEGITSENVDLQLSGHTHGGQIFPFHFFAKKANDDALAGFYDKNGVKLYVSRGAGYWGPAMRILAPSEITVLNFVPEQKNDK